LSATCQPSINAYGEGVTFSIPGRIELSATIGPPYSTPPPGGLSVSPVGSSCLQLNEEFAQEREKRTFSIPGRIELSATSKPATSTTLSVPFQYPRSDRVVCNLKAGSSMPKPARLSVSPVGSSCLQLHVRQERAEEERLSVSPVGSSCLQPGPRPIRSSRNGLSVSPVGSSCLQPHNRAPDPPELVAFSIPGRIELSATPPHQLPHTPIPATFQYPRSDRVVCNRETLSSAGGQARTFSIPGRIELSATQLRHRGRIYGPDFQYPRSDRVVCNFIPSPP